MQDTVRRLARMAATHPPGGRHVPSVRSGLRPSGIDLPRGPAMTARPGRTVVAAGLPCRASLNVRLPPMLSVTGASGCAAPRGNGIWEDVRNEIDSCGGRDGRRVPGARE